MRAICDENGFTRRWVESYSKEERKEQLRTGTSYGALLSVLDALPPVEPEQEG